MLFSTFANNTAGNIQATEALINELQQQLEAARQQLTAFQQQQQLEMTAKGAAEAALDTTRKAFKAVLTAYGAEGVAEFRDALVAILSENAEMLQLPASATDEDSDNEPTPSVPPVEPEMNDEPATVVEVEVVDESVAVAEETVNVEADTKEVATSVALPTPIAVASMKKPELIKHLQAVGLPTDGVVKDLRTRLTTHIMSQRKLIVKTAAA
ncbi:MAG: SAP domain-containing protein [Brasilonema octagenarum HA4186-MV1]|jgi:hypothetical protein|nr:SAP domain-containing protein [Brasilonema octagenarum HA4186-MV1]